MTNYEKIKTLENRMKQIPKEIKQAENEKYLIDKELKQAELEAELKNNKVNYFETLIREFVAEYGEDGEKMFREEYPHTAEEILKAKAKE